jgi:predicted dehydrogenase
MADTSIGRNAAPRKNLGVGVIGVGFIGRVHVNAARQAGARVVGVVASNPESSVLAANELEVDARFLDPQSLIEHPDVDVVHVCTPNYLHFSLVETAIANGKHVICEKPLATSWPLADQLAKAATKAGVVAAVPLTYRYHAMIAEARTRILDGQIGPIHLVHGSYLQDWLLSSNTGNWRVDASQGGQSRAFADIGTHWCDLAEWITGQRITELNALIETVESKRPAKSSTTFDGGVGEMLVDDWRLVTTEDLACLMFRTDGGIVGSLTVSQVSAGRKNRIWIELDGREGSLVFDEERSDRLWIGRDDGNQEIIRDPARLSPAARRLSSLPAGHNEGFVDNFVDLFKDVYGAVKGGPQFYPSFVDGARSAQLTEAVMRSSAERAWVKVEP